LKSAWAKLVKLHLKNKPSGPGMVVHICNNATQEVEVGGSQLQDGMPRQKNETLSEKQIKEQKD
jgi:hypothetical protein